MANNELIIYLCIALPMIPVVFAMRDKYSQRFLAFVIAGLTVCLFSAEVNTLLVNFFKMDELAYSTTISPINEEILKAIPLILFTILFAEKKDEVLPLAFAIGIGFSILESINVYCNNMETLTVSWALIRGIGAALMHSACTAMIAFGISYVFNYKKSFLQGIIGLFASAILYHATFNAFVQSKYSIIALLMPLLLFIPINYIEYKKKKYFENLEKEKLN